MNLFNILSTSVRDIAYTAIVFYFCFYLPGVLFFKQLKQECKGVVVYVVYPVVGMLLFALIAYMLAWLHLSLLLLPIIILVSIITIKKYGYNLEVIEKVHRKPLILVILLAFIFSLNMLGMGVFGNTIAYRGEDPVHLAYIAEMKVHFPPDNPGMAGIPLKGYHFLYQFIIASASSTFFIPIEALYFHAFPLIVSFWWAVGIYILMYQWCKRVSAGLWAVFLSMFGGSFGFILILQGHTKVNADSVFGINQPTVALINPQFAVSVPIVFTVLILMLTYFRRRSYKLLIPITLVVGLLPMVKIYGGVVLYSGFGFLILTELMKRRLMPIIFGALSVVLTFLTFGLFVGPGQGLIYDPLWPSHTVMLSNLPWYRYDEKYYTYSRLGVIRGILEIESFGLMLYFIGNLGMRIVGILFAFISLLFRRKLPSLFALTLFVMAAASTFIPLFFIQTGKVFETIQFAWYYTILASFAAALGFSYFFSLHFPRVLKVVFVLVIVVLSLPPAYNQYKDSGFSDPIKLRQNLSNPYFLSMDYLKHTGSYTDTVLEMPPVGLSPVQAALDRWYNSTSPDITAFGNHRTYINYEFIKFVNADPENRLAFVGKVLSLEQRADITYSKTKTKTFQAIDKQLREKGIVYVYSPDKLPGLVKGKVLQELYGNSIATIYKVL